MFGLKISSESKLFGGCHPCSRATSAILLQRQNILLPSAQYTVHVADNDTELTNSPVHNVVLRLVLEPAMVEQRAASMSSYYLPL